MMKRIVALILLTMIPAVTAPAQSRKKPRPKKPAAKTTPEEKPAPPIIGSNVAVVTKNGDHVSGTLVDLNAYSVKVKSDDLESVINLDTVATINFGGAAAAPKGQPTQGSHSSGDFTREIETLLASFQLLAAEIKNNTGYTEYGRQLTDLKRAAERFVVKYALSDDPAESRCAALGAAALTDYTWARTIWTLKFGYSGNTTVFETDSPAVADALSLYPELRQTAASANKFTADKLINGLWKKASEKIEVIRSVGSRSR